MVFRKARNYAGFFILTPVSFNNVGFVWGVEYSLQDGRFLVQYQEFQIFIQVGLSTNSNEGENGWENVLGDDQSICFVLQFRGLFILPASEDRAEIAGFLEQRTWDEEFNPTGFYNAVAK